MSRQVPVRTGGKVRYIEFKDAAAQLRETDVGPYQMPTLNQPNVAQVQSVVKGSYRDRAEGFNKVNYPVAAVFGICAIIVLTLGWNVPVFSMFALYMFWLAFLGWLMFAWTIHNVMSAEGVALVQAVFGFIVVMVDMRARIRQWQK